MKQNKQFIEQSMKTNLIINIINNSNLKKSTNSHQDNFISKYKEKIINNL